MKFKEGDIVKFYSDIYIITKIHSDIIGSVELSQNEKIQYSSININSERLRYATPVEVAKYRMFISKRENEQSNRTL